MGHAFEEIEAKFIDVDSGKLETKLKSLGAERQFKKLFRRYVFDFPSQELNIKNAWLRVRDEGTQVTMTFKQRTAVEKGKPDGGMKEVEIKVDNFEHAAELLRSIGMKPKFYEENWRTLYILDGVEVCIDEWPLIPPYAEIEADSWQEVDAVASKLGFDRSKRRVCSTMQIYEHYGLNENDYSLLTFKAQEKVKK